MSEYLSNGIKPSRESVNITLDVFGQRLCTIFTQIAFCFPQPAELSNEGIYGILSQGLYCLADNFPWTAGQVVVEGETIDNTGRFKIVPLEATPRIFVKDLRDNDSMPSMEELRRQGFPMSELDETRVAPRRSESGRPGQVICEVFQLQVTHIRGGVILTFLGQHQAMDGIGMSQVIRLFSKACKGEPFTQEELRIGNLAPEHVVPLLDHDWKPGPELQHNIVKGDVDMPGPGSFRTIRPPGEAVWVHFNIAAASLRRLKDLATKTKPDTVAYVSTDDVVSALIWQSITRARLHRLSGSDVTRVARAVDLRRYVNIPATHPGFVQSSTYHASETQKLMKVDLGEIAAELRRAVDPATSELGYYCRSFGTLISRTPDKRTTSYLAGFDLSKDIMLNSWANQSSYEQDFGLGVGVPEAVRRPRFEGFQGLVYLMPKSPTGDIGIAISLSEEDMTRLKDDAQFNRYATCIG